MKTLEEIVLKQNELSKKQTYALEKIKKEQRIIADLILELGEFFNLDRDFGGERCYAYIDEYCDVYSSCSKTDESKFSDTKLIKLWSEIRYNLMSYIEEQQEELARVLTETDTEIKKEA